MARTRTLIAFVAAAASIALTVRVALSVLLLLFIWFSYWMGWIEPRRYH